MKVFNMDLSKIEERVLASLVKVDAALQLPKHHPLRFTLLYGSEMRLDCISEDIEAARILDEFEQNFPKLTESITGRKPSEPEMQEWPVRKRNNGKQ
jgi:hypothetical protein